MAEAVEIEPEYEEVGFEWLGLAPGRFLAMAALWVVSLCILIPFVSDDWKRVVWFPDDRRLVALPPPTLEVLRARHEYLLDRLLARQEVIWQSSPFVYNWKDKSSYSYRDDPDGEIWLGGRQDFDHHKVRQSLSRAFMTGGWVSRLEYSLQMKTRRYVMVMIDGRARAARQDVPTSTLSLEVSTDGWDYIPSIHTLDCHDRTLGILRAILETNLEAVHIYGTREWPL